MFFLGIDGGGTKTAFLLINENGDIIEAKTIATVSYKHVGMDNSIALLKETVHEILNDREAYICLALPNWGESKDGDGEFLSRIKEITELPVKIVNDSVVGWAGSLGLSSGINLVAGTGSIAYGRNDAGEEARAGGWDERFSDEGSCYWLGMKSLELFSKESDGRAEKGALLEIFRNRFELKCDFDIIDIFNRRYRNDRTKIAGLQKYLLEAAQKGENTEKFFKKVKKLKRCSIITNIGTSIFALGILAPGVMLIKRKFFDQDSEFQTKRDIRNQMIKDGIIN